MHSITRVFDRFVNRVSVMPRCLRFPTVKKTLTHEKRPAKGPHRTKRDACGHIPTAKETSIYEKRLTKETYTYNKETYTYEIMFTCESPNSMKALFAKISSVCVVF